MSFRKTTYTITLLEPGIHKKATIAENKAHIKRLLRNLGCRSEVDFEMSDSQDKDPRSYGCPTCGARPHQNCTFKTDSRSVFHAKRRLMPGKPPEIEKMRRLSKVQYGYENKLTDR